jgi:GTPase
LTQPTYNSTNTLATMAAGIPTIAIVGRPNVGKSTLFNRIVGSRRAIVGDEPGITRDRLYGEAEWEGRRLRIVDTGGILPEEKDLIPAEIFRQARVALDEAAAIIMVVDGRTEIAGPDLELVRLLRKANRPLFLAVNKVDSEKQSSLINDFHRLGVKQMFPVSAEHGRGVDDLLDAVVEQLPKASTTEDTETTEESLPGEVAPANDEQSTVEVKVAIIGHPNVGKSTLLNCLTASDRAIVSPIPGTTRDAVDEVVEHDGRRFRFIDTAGIRRKGKTNLIAEKLSVIMARKHLERADVALLVADAAVGVTAGDATIAGYAEESGRSVIVVMNKWDLAIQKAHEAAKESRKQLGGKRAPRGRDRGSEDQRPKPIASDPERLAADYEILVRERLKFLSYAPVVFLSALTGERVEKLYGLIDRVAEARKRRISTGELNRWLASVDLSRGSSPTSRRVKIYYMTQSGVSPPTFMLFTNQKQRLHFSYERFLENQLRESFDFFGTPIRFVQRFREREQQGKDRAVRKRGRAD